jgi:hypothetical protein
MAGKVSLAERSRVTHLVKTWSLMNGDMTGKFDAKNPDGITSVLQSMLVPLFTWAKRCGVNVETLLEDVMNSIKGGEV